MARPSKYNPVLHPLQVYKMSHEGLTDEQMAKKLKIAVSTFNKWKLDFPEFSEALKGGKDFVDNLVEGSLLKRALGYIIEEITTKRDRFGQMKIYKKVKKEVLPDVTAIIFWLKNRRPKDWRDKREHEHSGKDGNPINITLVPASQYDEQDNTGK